MVPAAGGSFIHFVHCDNIHSHLVLRNPSGPQKKFLKAGCFLKRNQAVLAVPPGPHWSVTVYQSYNCKLAPTQPQNSHSAVHSHGFTLLLLLLSLLRLSLEVIPNACLPALPNDHHLVQVVDQCTDGAYLLAGEVLGLV